MEYINKIDLAKQTKLLSGNTADYGGSLILGEDLSIGRNVKFSGLGSVTGNTTLLVLDNLGNVKKRELVILNEPDFASDSETALATQHSIKEYITNNISSLVGTLQGGYNATTSSLPTNNSIIKGDYWFVTVAGTVQGVTFNVGDVIIANKNIPLGTNPSDYVFLEINRNQATNDLLGVVKLATNAEVTAGVNSEKVITPFTLKTILDTRIDDKYLRFVDINLPTSVFVDTLPAVQSASTITSSFKDQFQNTFFASPPSLSGTPTFRSIISNDLPSIDWNKITSGTTPTSLAGYGILDAYSKLQSDASYIRNQTGAFQNGSFKILGNGTASKLITNSGLTLNNLVSGSSVNSKGLGINNSTNEVFTYDLAQTVDFTGYVPTGRTLTINGVTLDLSQNRSWVVAGGGSGSGIGVSEEISFTGATGKINIDFGLNDRLINFGTNPLLLLYTITGTTKVFYPVGNSYDLNTNLLTVDGVYGNKTLVLVGTGGGGATGTGGTVNAYTKAESTDLFAPISGSTNYIQNLTGNTYQNGGIRLSDGNSIVVNTNSSYDGSIGIYDTIANRYTYVRKVGLDLIDNNGYTQYARTYITYQGASGGFKQNLIFSAATTGNTNIIFPNKSGTIALIGDIPAGYIPYTGATQNVVLGTNRSLSVGNLSLVSNYITGSDGFSSFSFNNQSINISSHAINFTNTGDGGGSFGWFGNGSNNPLTEFKHLQVTKTPTLPKDVVRLQDLSGYTSGGTVDAYTKAQSDAKYPGLGGIGAIGTWGINISGDAANSTRWGAQQLNGVTTGTPNYLFGSGGAGNAYYYTVDQLKNWLNVPAAGAPVSGSGNYIQQLNYSQPPQVGAFHLTQEGTFRATTTSYPYLQVSAGILANYKSATESLLIIEDYLRFRNSAFVQEIKAPVLTGNSLIILPNKSGTVALTTDIPAVTGYVPYTGAIVDVNLGTRQLNAGYLGATVGIGLDTSTSGGHIGVKFSNTQYTAMESNGFGVFKGSGTNYTQFRHNGIHFQNVGDGTSFGQFFQHTDSVLTSNSLIRLPNKSGTVALTSDLTPYALMVNPNQNIRLGLNSGRIATGYQNVFIGEDTGYNMTSASGNVFLGFAAGYNTTTNANTALGWQSMYYNTTGVGNIALGYQAGQLISSGGNATIINESIFIGYDTRALANSQTNQIVIGHGSIGLGSNSTLIGNSGTTVAKIYGTLQNGSGTNYALISDITGSTATNDTRYVRGDISTTQSFANVTITGSFRSKSTDGATNYSYMDRAGFVVYQNTTMYSAMYGDRVQFLKQGYTSNLYSPSSISADRHFNFPDRSGILAIAAADDSTSGFIIKDTSGSPQTANILLNGLITIGGSDYPKTIINNGSIALKPSVGDGFILTTDHFRWTRTSTSGFSQSIVPAPSLSGDSVFNLPNKSGTVAVLSDIIGNYITNSTTQQATSNFSISGNGVVAGKGTFGTTSVGSAHLSIGAPTSSTASMLINWGTAYTGNTSGSIWGETTDLRLRLLKGTQLTDFIFGANNFIFKNSNSLNVIVSDGSTGSVAPLKAEAAFTRYPTAISYIVLVSDIGFGSIIAVTDTSTARTITLPLASSVSAGFQLNIKDESLLAGTNNITITLSGSDTSDVTNITTNGGWKKVYSDGVSKWFNIT